MIVMKQVHLANVDLNLLVVFDALITERHATRAAERIGLTQPAVSHALNRLRGLFGDPLFVRSPRGMVPTPAALEAAPAVRSILEQIENVLHGRQPFDTARSTRQFTIGLSDYAAVVMLPLLTARLNHEAPEVSLVVRNTNSSTGLSMLEDGSVELIAGVFPSPPPHMQEELLYEEDFICAMHSDRAVHEVPLGLGDYLSRNHLQVSTRGNPHGYADAALAKQGLKRNVTITVEHFLMAPLLADTSRLVATEPHRLFNPFADRFPLQLFQPPIDIPSFRVVQTWHARHNADPGHQWLRWLVHEISQQV